MIDNIIDRIQDECRKSINRRPYINTWVSEIRRMDLEPEEIIKKVYLVGKGIKSNAIVILKTNKYYHLISSDNHQIAALKHYKEYNNSFGLSLKCVTEINKQFTTKKLKSKSFFIVWNISYEVIEDYIEKETENIIITIEDKLVSLVAKTSVISKKKALKLASLIVGSIPGSAEIEYAFSGYELTDGHKAYGMVVIAKTGEIYYGVKAFLSSDVKVFNFAHVGAIRLSKFLMRRTIDIDIGIGGIQLNIDQKINAEKIYSILTNYKIRFQNEQRAEIHIDSDDLTIKSIKKFKELLDLGAITQEEFDTKKTSLLNN